VNLITDERLAPTVVEAVRDVLDAAITSGRYDPR
jgi:hypothetical protein